ncbi:MAG TPA: hypothetical protein VF549_02475 [Solirubrobacteraceae bacterium]|jgi:hypothetical protein
MGRPLDIAALVRSADASAVDVAGLTTLLRRSWPASSDGTRPAARDWLRRWRPVRVTAQPADCACAAGTCGWCN